MTDRDILVERYLDDSLPPERLSEFADEIVRDPSLVDALVQSVTVDDLLSEHAEARGDRARVNNLEALLIGYSRHRSSSTAAAVGNRPGRSLKEGTGTLASWSIRRVFERKLGASSLFQRTAAVSAAAISVACLALVFVWNGWFGSPPAAKAPAAKFARSANVEWGPGAHRWSVGEPIREGDEIRLDGGRVEIVFDSGAVMTLVGPAALQVQSPMVASLRYGTATTRIENVKSGEFRLLTPSTNVVDLGTEFGVKVEPNGETDVVVFEGEVDLVPPAPYPPERVSRRLTIGEGIRLNRAGLWERIVSVENDAYPFGERMFHFSQRGAPVIVGIFDDRRPPASPKFYRICRKGIGEDVQAFVDRPYEWNGVTAEGMPGFLIGADYVQTFNDDKDSVCPKITVEVSSPCMLYLFYDDRMVVPEWLSKSFEDTGLNIGLDEGRQSTADGPGESIDQICSIWRRRVEEAGFVELGLIGDVKSPRFDESYPSERTMFGIAAQPLP